MIAVTESFSQKQVAITIDDVPSTKKYQQNNYEAKFLNSLDSLSVPVTIFINESYIYKYDSIVRNFELLNEWIRRNYVTPGNHTFAHSHYSEVGIDSFRVDVLKGAYISKELAKKYNKTVDYFRFPYNDLGNSLSQHQQIKAFLDSVNYIITPFTVGSSDWMFSFLYKHYKNNGEENEASRIADEYINTTLACFDYFDSLAVDLYSRPVKQIYLCHDNVLNTDYLHVLVKKLKEKNYSFISLEEALSDSIYQQQDYFHKSWGISWFYRWIEDPVLRKQLMRKEPEPIEIYKEYQKINGEIEY